MSDDEEIRDPDFTKQQQVTLETPANNTSNQMVDLSATLLVK